MWQFSDMSGGLRNIFSFKRPHFFRNGKAFFADLQIINKYLLLKESRFTSERDLHKFLIKIFSRINAQTSAAFNLYGSERKRKSEWRDLLNSLPVKLPYISQLEKNFNTVFKKTVNLHSSTYAILALRIEQEFFYIIEVTDTKYSRHYYELLFSALTKLMNLYTQVRERHNLESRLDSMQRVLAEKERSLLIAEKAVKRKVYDLHNLVEASNEIYSILNFKQLINSALLTIIGQVGAQNAFSLMFDNQKHSFSRNFQKAFKEKDIQALAFKSDSPLAIYLRERGSPVFIHEIRGNQKLMRIVAKLEKTGVALLAPIMYSERLQGVIGVGEKLYGNDFTQTDFELFHVLVNIISISIENAVHYEEVKNLSLTDGMTNLHNYRYFAIRLKEELNRARRNETKVSLLILDIDHFKNYNDTLGHQAGDEALRTLGKILKNTVRDEDVVARYGGEEFCIILPDISKDGIEPLGERVRRMIEIYKFYKENVQPGGKITISLGGATFPDDATDPDILIQRADEALYSSKNLGRNKLTVFNTPSKAARKKSKKKELQDLEQ